ncbi:family 88 glycosyl hydrolase [Parascardovia denticolens IPLA 20019]|nr:glycoside hydrolase family 88 protein [Parascardovia denticolens]EFG33194.2 hypothetical protein HMPREF9017_00606 [Parascardovia denticolens F0305]EIT88048.1 family 88 glycosyl hydrolase [Parascardovia denticolens IPLA 20019]BAR05526.1 glycosyl hydrolase [Parascardovia denticolens DSM 10105 = JCM 12538]
MKSDFDKSTLIKVINKLSLRMVELTDDTGEFSFRAKNGRLIDNKSFRYWEWTAGVGLYGLWRYYSLTREQRILHSIEEWFSDQFSSNEQVEKNINTMAPVLTLAFLYEETGDKKYLPYLENWGDWIYHELPRVGGAFQHVTLGDSHPGEIWDDTLMMSVLALAKIGVLLNDKSYVEEAKKQALLHIYYLQDKATGYWYHGWSFNERSNLSSVFWGRGNSWATIALPELVAVLGLGPSDSFYQVVQLSFENQVRSLLEVQSPTGMWHTVLDDDASYEESSATAGIAYGLLLGIHMRLLDRHYHAAALRAVHGLIGEITDTGDLNQVSIGTPLGKNKESYMNIRLSTMPYGQAMAILALTEYLREFY